MKKNEKNIKSNLLRICCRWLNLHIHFNGMRNLFSNKRHNKLMYDPTETYPEYECSECGKPIMNEGYCSDRCWNASMR